MRELLRFTTLISCVIEGTFQWNNDRPLKRIGIVYSVNIIKYKYADETQNIHSIIHKFHNTCDFLIFYKNLNIFRKNRREVFKNAF